MSNKTISKSFRLPDTDVLWLKEFAKDKGISQTDIMMQSLALTRLNEGKSIALNVMEQGGVVEDKETLDFLKGLGIAGVGGIAGYHMSGIIRKTLDMDEDKGTQMLFGLLAGLGSLVIHSLMSKK
jgi:hypothetical protein